jgi:hypothetical protein
MQAVLFHVPALSLAILGDTAGLMMVITLVACVLPLTALRGFRQWRLSPRNLLTLCLQRPRTPMLLPAP